MKKIYAAMGDSFRTAVPPGEVHHILYYEMQKHNMTKIGAVYGSIFG